MREDPQFAAGITVRQSILGHICTAILAGITALLLVCVTPAFGQ
jgi:hypothetical protein